MNTRRQIRTASSYTHRFETLGCIARVILTTKVRTYIRPGKWPGSANIWCLDSFIYTKRQQGRNTAAVIINTRNYLSRNPLDTRMYVFLRFVCWRLHAFWILGCTYENGRMPTVCMYGNYSNYYATQYISIQIHLFKSFPLLKYSKCALHSHRCY